jgi:hypothetical protein
MEVAMEDNRETGITILDEETWEEFYGTVPNPYTQFRLFDSSREEEMALVLDTVSLNRVWSWLPNDEDELDDFLQNGYYPEKAMGYYITEAPYNPQETIIVNLSR